MIIMMNSISQINFLNKQQETGTISMTRSTLTDMRELLLQIFLTTSISLLQISRMLVVLSQFLLVKTLPSTSLTTERTAHHTDPELKIKSKLLSMIPQILNSISTDNHSLLNLSQRVDLPKVEP